MSVLGKWEDLLVSWSVKIPPMEYPYSVLCTISGKPFLQDHDNFMHAASEHKLHTLKCFLYSRTIGTSVACLGLHWALVKPVLTNLEHVQL
jgi:hypothetical protein